MRTSLIVSWSIWNIIEMKMKIAVDVDVDRITHTKTCRLRPFDKLSFVYRHGVIYYARQTTRC